MKKNSLTDKIKYTVFCIALLFSIGCNKKYKDFPNEEKAYKIETQYFGECLTDSCIIIEKKFFPNGQHMEIYHHNPGIRTSLYDEKGKTLIMLLEYNNKYEKTFYSYDSNGNETEIRKKVSYNESEGIAKRENYYTIDDRIKKQVLYDFNSKIEGVNLFNYDTLGYSLINEKIHYPDTELRTTHYYQNNLLVKITRNFSFNRMFEFSYDSLGRLIYEDLLYIPSRVYYKYDNNLLDKSFEVSKLGDTIKKTTYQYVLDSLQRPIQINTLIENSGDETKKTTTIIKYK